MVIVRERTQGTLLPTLGLFTTSMLIVGSMIGSGIFRLPSTMMQKVQDPTLLILVWVVGGLLTICGALTFAELAGMFPQAGGQYVFLRESMGKRWAFLYGWTFFWVVMTGIIAAVAVVFASFTQRLFGEEVLPSRYLPFIAVGIIAILTAVNYIGVKFGGIVNNIFTVSKFAALIAIIVLGFAIGDQSADPVVETTTTKIAGPLLIVGFILAMLQGFFALDGWPQAAYVAPEVKDATRNVPRAMIFGVGAVTLAYVLATAAYVFLLTKNEILGIAEGGGVIAAEATKAFSGESGAKLISAAVMVSTFGTVNAYILTSPRIFYAIAKDGLFWHPFQKIHPAFNTPHVSLIYQGIWAGLIVALSGITKDAYTLIVEAVVFGIWLFYIPTVIGYFRLRRQRPDHPRPFKTPLYPYVPALFFGAACVVVATLLTTNLWSLFTGKDVLFGNELRSKDYFALSGLWGTLLILTGLPVLWMWRRREKAGLPTPVSSTPAEPAA